MLRRTETTIGTIVLAVAMVAMTCCGVLMGLVRVWPKMGLCFVLAFYSAECCAILLLNHRIESRFKELKELITGKSGSDRLVGRFVPNSVLICMLIFIPGLIILSMLACNRGRWLALCVLLGAFLITNAVSSAVIIWLKIKSCSRRLEEVISKNKESEVYTEKV
ncbi:hypothetical protein ACFL5Z_11150 [Planctomycetota bacterium]